jgi:hypothetical protein
MKQRCGEERGGCYSVLLGLSVVNGARRRVDDGSRLGRRMIREEEEDSSWKDSHHESSKLLVVRDNRRAC